jgi:hypothetical protein
MEAVAFRQQLLRGRKTLGQKDEITVSVTPQWVKDVLPYTYRAFPILGGGTGSGPYNILQFVYRAFPILQRSPTHPLGL